MRNITFILLAIIVISCNSSSYKDFEENLKYINNLKGNIKKIKSETFNATEKFGEPVKGESAEPYFDLSEHLFNIITPNSTIEFAKNGKLILREINGKRFSYSFKITYDEKWNVLEEYFSYEQNESTTKYKMDGNKITNSISYDKNGDVASKTDFKYENNLIKEVTSINNDGEIINNIKYSYNGDVQNQDIYNVTGLLIQSSKRDINGRYLELDMFGNEKIIPLYLDKNPFPSEIQIFNDDEIDGKLEISMNDNKDISEIKEIGEDGDVETLYKYVYKYDKQGNWTERISYEDDELEYITVRTIEYY